MTNSFIGFEFKELPEGAAFSAVFIETKDQLLACKLRVSQKSAADHIWEDSRNGRLMTILKKNLLRGLDPEMLSHLTMRINIMQEEYQTACEILAGIFFRFSFGWRFNFQLHYLRLRFSLGKRNW